MITKKTFFYMYLLLLITSLPVFSQEIGSGTKDTLPNIDETTLSVDSTPAVNTQNNQAPALNKSLSTFSVWDVVRMVLVLGGVLGVIYLLFFLLKKVGHSVKDTGNIIHIIATKNLNTNSAVHIIKIGGEVFFVGAGDGNVRFLSEITDKETLDQLILESSTSLAPNRSFSDVIKGALHGGGVLRNIDSERNAFLKQQKDRLKNM